MKKKSSNRKQITKGTKPTEDFKKEKKPFRDNPERPVKTEGHNDDQWLAATEEMAINYGSFAYNRAAGLPFNLRSLQHGVDSTFVTPGVMCVEIAPGYGISTNATSPLNVSGQANYTNVRHRNSGHTNYESADLTMYVLGCGSLFSMYAWLLRAYGILSYYNTNNRYTPKAIYYALGLNYDDFIHHISDFRAFICQCAYQINQLYVPDIFPYFKRRVWVNSNIYSDGTTDKSQLYMYSDRIWPKFSGTTQGGSALTIQSPGTNLLTFSQLVDKCTDIINSYLLNEDCGVISGDLLKAYGPDAQFKVATPDPEFSIKPVYDLEMVATFEGVTVLCDNPSDASTIISDNSTWVHQENGAVIFNPTMDPASVRGGITESLLCQYILNSHVNIPTPFDNLRNTRFAFRVYLNEEGDCAFDSIGTEIPLYARTIELNSSTGDPQSVNLMFGAVDTDIPDLFTKSLDTLSKFSFHPMQFISNRDAPGYPITRIIGDLDNYTLLSAADLAKTHMCTLLTLFNVPTFRYTTGVK